MRLQTQSIQCGDQKIPNEIREKILKGETPEWVPEKYKKSYNTIDRASLELMDIKCADTIIESVDFSGDILEIVLRKNTIVQKLKIGKLQGIKKVWLEGNTIKFLYKEPDTLGDKILFFSGGAFSGMAVTVLIALLL